MTYDAPLLRSVHQDFTHDRGDDWRDRAACAGTDGEAFFSPDGAPIVKAAKDTCSSCPVRQRCAEYAINDASLSGYWGGLSEKKRKEIRAKRRDEAAA